MDEVLVLHAYQIDNFGGHEGVLDIRLLEAALSRPKTILARKEMFPTICGKAAILATGIINNHPFVDGNKRTGMHAMLVFLELNDIEISISDKTLVKLGNSIAKDKYSTKELTKYLNENTSQHNPR